MDANWKSWNFETFPGGASSAVAPDLLPDNQTAWGQNVAFRGAKVQTRPPIACRLVLPPGLIQGASYFGVQGGMIVVMIAGKPYRLRIGGTDPAAYSSEEISLASPNSGVIKQVWMAQTVETLVIQDGQSDAILYNGSVATRAGYQQVPRGRMMAYGNGRLWVAINANELVAGDIRTRDPGSELNFTETTYLSGGGSLWFSRPMTGLTFIPVTGTTDYGTLLVLGVDFADSVRADITDRDSWGTYPGFVTTVLRSIGCAGAWSLAQVNQDVYWRDGLAQIRSLRASLQDESGAGSSPLSREVSRIVDFDSQQLLPWVSSIYFNNRLLMTASPFLNPQGGVSFRDLVSLDFAPISTMQGKTSPAYDGNWQGVDWTQLVAGQFGGRQRAFGLSSDNDGFNRLWELGASDTVHDITLSCGSGSPEVTSPIGSFIEYPRVDFSDPKQRKRLTRLDVWLSEIVDEITLTPWWRTDNDQQWTQWQETISECATTTDDATTTPHVWKNLLPQQRPLIKSFSIPDVLDDVIKYQRATGFTFQVRLAWTGSMKIQRATLWANPVQNQTDYVDRAGQGPDCVLNDVSGNELVYEIPVCPAGLGIEIEVADPDADIPDAGSSNFGEVAPNDPVQRSFTITNPGYMALELGTVTIEAGAFSIISQPDVTTLYHGETATFVLGFESDTLGDYSALVTIPNNSRASAPFTFTVDATVAYAVQVRTCRTKPVTAQLCGFSEFTDASVPPKKYRVKDTTGQFARCVSTLTCADPGCGTPPSVPDPLSGTGSDGTIYTGSVSYVGYNSVTGKHKYQWHGISAIPLNPCDPTWMCAGKGVVNWPGFGATTLYNSGDIFELAACSAFTIGIVFYSIFGYNAIPGATGGTGFTPPAGDEPYTLIGVFDRNDTYDADTCELATVDDGATYDLLGACSGIVGGSPGIPPVIPSGTCTTVSESATTRSTDGDATCYDAGPSVSEICLSDGTGVTEQLSVEDTPADAAVRALAAGIWSDWAPSDQTTCLASWEPQPDDGFDFFLQGSQCRMDASGMDPLSSYNVVTVFYRRVYGSPGPFVIFQTDTDPITVLPDGTGELTKDIPNEDGYETIMFSMDVVPA